MKAKHLRLVLGDQLNPKHSWFDKVDDSVMYLIAELHQEATYTKHHMQKISAFFAAMHDFVDYLKRAGHRVCYLTLDDTKQYQDLPGLISALTDSLQCESFSFQQPDEYRLKIQLTGLKERLKVPVYQVQSEHFLLAFSELPKRFNSGTHNTMDPFYRYMRKRFSILMEGENPVGGTWNFDKENRKPLKSTELKSIPKPLVFENSAAEYVSRIKKHNIDTLGHETLTINYPINRQQSLTLLQFFCTHQLVNFGHFQDAMTMASPYAWSLYHSRLSFSLNTKMLCPAEVIATAVSAYEEANGEISLAQVEGFIRQILGWREYVRGMYWVNMPNYQQQNFFNAKRDLPDFFWHGKTKMQCMKSAVSQSLEHAYAHHIQRLMITGNFALLAGISPSQVDDWYLGIYIDAIEWVELPNTRGMALFADGGWIATKPYAASGNYVNKMSDYCKGCHYQVKKRVGDMACPLNSLYWNFIDENHGLLSVNHRMSFPVRHWDKMATSEKIEIKAHATSLLNDLNSL